MSTKQIYVRHTDDYRDGPELICDFVESHDSSNESNNSSNESDNSSNESDNSSDESNNIDDKNNIIINIYVNDKYRVYYIGLDIGDEIVDFLKEFENFDDALFYCKQQYFLYTGDFSFTSDGDCNSASHPNGGRPEIDVPDEMDYQNLKQREL